MEAFKMDSFEKRGFERKKVSVSASVALKSILSKNIYRNFSLKNYSTTGAYIVFHYTKEDPEYRLLSILSNKCQKKFLMCLNALKHRTISKKLQDISTAVNQNLWIEIPCEIIRFEKNRTNFGLGIKFLSKRDMV